MTPEINDQFDQLPPHDLNAEQALIGSMMLCGAKDALFVEMTAGLAAEDFFQPDNGILFKVVKDLRTLGTGVDAITVRAELERRGMLQEVGGAAYLAQVLGTVPSAAHGPHYAKIVRDLARLREMISASNDLLRACYSAQAASETPTDILQRHIDRIAKVRTKGAARTYKTLSDVLGEAIDAVESGGSHLIKTGLAQIDDAIGGLGEGEVIIVAARPSMGKSTLLRTFTRSLGDARVPVGYISLEESTCKIGRNLISAEAGVENRRLRAGDVQEDEWPRLAKAVNAMAPLPVYIASGISRLADIKDMVTLWKAKHGIKVLILDYLQQVNAPGNTSYERVSNVSREMACLVRELGIAGIFAAQINRGVESRSDTRPKISDLKESGQIEQDADVILLLHREDYYRIGDREYSPTGELEIIVGKARDSTRGRVIKLQSDLRYQRFSESVPEGL